MADLLECLIQIKGLADTPRRLAVRAADFTAALPASSDTSTGACAVACTLVAAEARFRRALDAMLSRDRPTLETLPGDGAGDIAPPVGAESRQSFESCERRFAEARAATVRVLEACTAEQLNRVGIDPLRGPMTVADLVAVMLAHDTDRLGDLVPR